MEVVSLTPFHRTVGPLNENSTHFLGEKINLYSVWETMKSWENLCKTTGIRKNKTGGFVQHRFHVPTPLHLSERPSICRCRACYLHRRSTSAEKKNTQSHIHPLKLVFHPINWSCWEIVTVYLTPLSVQSTQNTLSSWAARSYNGALQLKQTVNRIRRHAYKTSSSTVWINEPLRSFWQSQEACSKQKHYKMASRWLEGTQCPVSDSYSSKYAH